MFDNIILFLDPIQTTQSAHTATKRTEMTTTTREFYLLIINKHTSLAKSTMKSSVVLFYFIDSILPSTTTKATHLANSSNFLTVSPILFSENYSFSTESTQNDQTTTVTAIMILENPTSTIAGKFYYIINQY